MKKLIAALLISLMTCMSHALDYKLDFNPDSDVQKFALALFKQSLDEKGYSATSSDHLFKITISDEEDTELKSESYSYIATPTSLRITASDDNGLLYAVLDITEAMENGVPLDQLASKSESPAYPFRAIKFNLPWRSYRFGPALQQHMETCRDLAFWERFLDMMAENRFNALSLWNLHPFSYMIRAKNFPFACDLKTDEELADWQNFYHELFRMAKERGIETYIVNWNIFVPDGFVEHYGISGDRNVHKWNKSITPEMDEIVRRYTRESVTQVLEEYPNLTGIGLSLGEAMNGMSTENREEWVLDTIVRGVQEANRPAKLIHRVPFAAGNRNFGSMSKEAELLTRKALEGIEGVDGDILVEVKFNWSHAHSTPELVKVHGGDISDTYWNPAPENYKLIWMARNEDFFFLNWGQADFIRDHIRLNKHDYVGGYFVGSEMYIPALDYFTKPGMEVDWDYAFERQWLFYKMWGRLLYNPQTPDSIFNNAFSARYGENYSTLLDAYEVASQIPLLICSNWDVSNDRSIYAEMFRSNRRSKERRAQLISVSNLIADKPLDPDFVSIRDYVETTLSEKTFSPDRVTPLQLADQFEDLAKRSLLLIKGFKVTNDSLAYEIGDIQAWAHLSFYMADKIRGTTSYHFFEQSKNATYQNQAIDHLKQAKDHWIDLVKITEKLYPEAYCQILPNGLDEKWHWSKLLPDVQADIDFVSNP